MEIDGTDAPIIDTTVGRIIFNQPSPGSGLCGPLRSGEHFLSRSISWSARRSWPRSSDRCITGSTAPVTAEMLDHIKAQGYKYSTKGAITVAVAGRYDPRQKKPESWHRPRSRSTRSPALQQGLISNEERYNGVQGLEQDHQRRDKRPAGKPGPRNPIFMMADSGARGSMDQIRQLAGMRGLMANTVR